VALIGRRDHHETANLREEPAQWGVLDLSDRDLRARGFRESSRDALERLSAPRLAGFWVHVDADVLDPAFMPAVDSPLPGGLSLADAETLLAPLVRHPKALGVHVSIYDPALDIGGSAGRHLMTLLEHLLMPVAQGVPA
jgi:arginase